MDSVATHNFSRTLLKLRSHGRPALLSLLAIVVPVSAQEQSPVTPVRIADEVCAGCHQKIFDSYVKTVMANASGPAAEGVILGTFRHRTSGVEFRVSTTNGKVWLSFDRPGEFDEGGLHGRRQLEYFVGSGNRGRTYLYTQDKYWFEAPINWYTSLGGYDMRPGFQTSITAPFDLPVASRCLHCHTSEGQLEIPGTRNKFSSVPFRHTGITCETCHGDSGIHVASGGKGRILNPAKLEPLRRDSICEQCHLEAEILIDRAGKKLAQFRPGDLLSDFASYFVHAGAPKAGFGPVTQVEALPLSKCKQKSGDELTCTTCHDPHNKPSTAERIGYYRKKCLHCHSSPEFAERHHAENPDCMNCHMPRNPAVDIPHQQATDHRIPRFPEESSLTPPPPRGRELVPVLSATIEDRDLGLAYVRSVELGDDSALEPGLFLLQSAAATKPGDSPLLAGLAYLQKKRGEEAEATRNFQKALTVDPNNSWAAANLGVLYKKAGKTEQALSVWEQVFSRTPFYAGMNLSLLHCSLGRVENAKTVLMRMLEFDPDSLEIRRGLAELKHCPKP
jgi:tetratricopeptide (TPR) repeat protein